MTASAEHIVDSSAILAYLRDEPGADKVSKLLALPSIMSVINWAEVLTWYARAGLDPKKVETQLYKNGLPFGLIELVLPEIADAVTVADLYRSFPDSGLSLADRFCISLALRLKLQVITADRAWSKLSLNLKITRVR